MRAMLNEHVPEYTPAPVGHADLPLPGPTEDKTVKMSYRIMLPPPHLDGYEPHLLLDVLEFNWIAPLGPHVYAFERTVGPEATPQNRPVIG